MKRSLIILALGLSLFRTVQAQGTYTTGFPLTEDPMSEGGRWTNGETAGLDWKNVRTTPGLAFGADATGTPVYNDPTAILTGVWGPNQWAQATVYSVNQRNDANQEVELRLRTTIAPHVNSGYEINFRCTHDGTQYTEIVRWNGSLGSFTYLAQAAGPGIYNGDVVKATITGSTIRAYINDVQVNMATDSTFTSGSPGIGFYLNGGAGSNGTFGFTNFTASDGGTPPAAPKNLRIIQM